MRMVLTLIIGGLALMPMHDMPFGFVNGCLTSLVLCAVYIIGNTDPRR